MPDFAADYGREQWLHQIRVNMAVFAALAAGPHLAGHGLLNLAVRYLPAPVVNLSLAGEPILSTSYAAALFDEWPGRWFYGGAALILGGLLVQFAGRRSRKRGQP